MTRIGGQPASNAVLNATNNTTATQAQPKQEKYIRVTLEFTAEELNIKRGKTMPETVRLSEKRVEDRLFKRFNFDARNLVDMELMKLRLDTNETPHEAIDWQSGGKQISTFTAVRTADGNYQVELLLSQKTAEQLRGQSFPTAPNARLINPNETLAARNGVDAQTQRAKINAKLNQPNLEGLTPQQKELVLDLLDVGLSVAGIFDPTPISDGAGAGLALSRGDFWGAGINVVGMIPFLGDIAKLGKLPKLVKIIEKVVDVAKADSKFANTVEGLLKTLKNALDKIPLDKLPKPIRESVQSIKNKLDDFFAAKAAIAKTPKVDYKGNPYSIKDRERIAELGKDPKRGLKNEEGEAGLAAEKEHGLKLNRYQDESLEFVDESGKLWDVVSPISIAPNGRAVFNETSALRAIKGHLLKGNVIVDLGRLNPADAQKLQNLVKSITEAEKRGNQILLVRR